MKLLAPPNPAVSGFYIHRQGKMRRTQDERGLKLSELLPVKGIRLLILGATKDEKQRYWESSIV